MNPAAVRRPPTAEDEGMPSSARYRRLSRGESKNVSSAVGGRPSVVDPEVTL
jgi:hypothetical protein